MKLPDLTFPLALHGLLFPSAQAPLPNAASSALACPKETESCSTTADQVNACCVVKPGGALVHAQFWDVDEGVKNSWGIHGL
jgi:hypothetical protein